MYKIPCHFHQLKEIIRDNKITLFIITILLLSYIISNELVAKNRFCEIFILNNIKKRIELRIEVAETYMAMSKGLMNRKSLDRNNGMLFVFKEEGKRSFWMKNTYIPLSIAYIDRNGIINEIYDMKPLDASTTYPSKRPAMYALEVNRDWFKKNNIISGCKVVFNGCVGK